MSALVETGILEVGVEVDGVFHREFSLRPATLADAYRGVEAVPVPGDIADSKSAQVAYQTRVDDATILSQVTRLGGLEPVPGVAALVEVIDPDDMTQLRAAALALKKKRLQSRGDSLLTATLNSSLSAPASG